MEKRKGHKFLIPVLVIFILLVVIAFIIPIDKTGSSSTVSGKYIDDLTDDQQTAIDDILEQCGIDSITEMKHDEGLDNAHQKGETGYRITSGGVKNVILYLNKDKKVKLIKYADHKLYTKGKVKANLWDYVVDKDEVNSLMIQCEEAVKSVLKSPSTAKFPAYTGWGFTQKKKNVYLVSGYVDAQNSLGAETRSEFAFKIKDNKIVSFIFDGQQIVKE